MFNLLLAYTYECLLRAARARKKIRLRCLYALDVRAEFAQFFIEPLITAVDVIDATHLGNSIRFKSRKHQCRRRAQVACHHRRTEKMIDSFYDGCGLFHTHLRSHAFQFRHMHVPLRKNIFRN